MTYYQNLKKVPSASRSRKRGPRSRPLSRNRNGRSRHRRSRRLRSLRGGAMAVGDTCSICHNVLTQAEHDAGDLTVAVCGNAHLFHTVCFRQWNAGHNTCPDCRNYVGAVGGGLFTPANRRELIDAVFAMMQNRRATLADLGPLRMWDTRLVTDFHQVFEYFY